MKIIVLFAIKQYHNTIQIYSAYLGNPWRVKIYKEYNKVRIERTEKKVKNFGEKFPKILIYEFSNASTQPGELK